MTDCFIAYNPASENLNANIPRQWARVEGATSDEIPILGDVDSCYQQKTGHPSTTVSPLEVIDKPRWTESAVIAVHLGILHVMQLQSLQHEEIEDGKDTKC